MNAVFRLLTICLIAALVGCAAGDPTGERGRSFFPLRYAEVDADDSVVQLPTYADPPPPGGAATSIHVRATIVRPQEFRGRTVVLRFKSLDDPEFRIISSSRRYTRFSISAQDGRGFLASDGQIYFVSKDSPKVSPLEPEPSRPAAAQRP